MHATHYVFATGGVTASAADHRQALIGTDARALCSVLLKKTGADDDRQKKLEIRFLVGTTISYIRRGPFLSLACDSMRGASLTVHTQARPPGPALAAAPEADLVRRLGAAGPAVRDEERSPAERRWYGGAHGAGLVVSQIDRPS